MIQNVIMISCDLGQLLIGFKGNRLVGESGKVNLVILYRNELDPEKMTITQELYGQMLLRDQVWMKNKSTHPRDGNT